MKGLIPKPGKISINTSWSFEGYKSEPYGPPPLQVPIQMQKLFEFLNKEKEVPWLIKACVFHYELEFIHPFADGNGRMGRLWQQLILMKQSSLFEFISAETIIHKRQRDYYNALEKSDNLGIRRYLLNFHWKIFYKLCRNLAVNFATQAQALDRIERAIQHFGKNEFQDVNI